MSGERDAIGRETSAYGIRLPAVNLDGITNPLTRNSTSGNVTAYTQGSITYTISYGTFGVSSITGGGSTMTVNYSTAGIPSGITLS